MSYDKLEQEVSRSKAARDLSRDWAQWQPLTDAPSAVRERIEAFAREKRITVGALELLGTRWRSHKGGAVALGWATFVSSNGHQVPSGIKFRLLGSGDRGAVPGSVYVEPIVVGDPSSLHWFVAEGESDGARLAERVGDDGTVLVLPAGAKTWQRDWGDRIPRGAAVYLALDADKAGDAGAEKIAHALGGRTVRLRSPVEDGDWCDWPGARDEFVELVAAARQSEPRYEFTPLDEFLGVTFPSAEPPRATSFRRDPDSISGGWSLDIIAPDPEVAIGDLQATVSGMELPKGPHDRAERRCAR